MRRPSLLYAQCPRASTHIGADDFTCFTTGDVVTVEYTFGYKRCSADGKPRICLHHSSLPYKQ